MSSDAYKKCIDFLLEIPNNNNGSANAIIINDKGVEHKIKAHACHANYILPFYVKNKYQDDPIEATASAISLSSENQYIAIAFAKWASSKQSPWTLLFQNGLEFVKDSDGFYRGFVIHGESIKKVPFNLIKNFAIVCRSLTENMDRWKLWYILTSEKKMKEVDAWYLVSCFYPYRDAKKEILGLSYSDVRSGGHWGLSDGSAEGSYIYNGSGNKAENHKCVFDFTRARTGNVNMLPIPSINGFFCSEIKGREGFSNKKLTLSKTGGKFSQVSVYNIDDTVNEFYKWQDQEGILE